MSDPQAGYEDLLRAVRPGCGKRGADEAGLAEEGTEGLWARGVLPGGVSAADWLKCGGDARGGDGGVGEVKACEAQEESAVAAEEGFGEDSIPEPPGGKKSKPRTRPRSKRERMRTSLQEILDVEGAAAALGVSRRLVLRLLRAGELPGKKVGREWRILRSAIVGWLKEPAGGKEPQWLEKAREAGRIVKVEGPEGPGER